MGTNRSREGPGRPDNNQHTCTRQRHLSTAYGIMVRNRDGQDYQNVVGRFRVSSQRRHPQHRSPHRGKEVGVRLCIQEGRIVLPLSEDALHHARCARVVGRLHAEVCKRVLRALSVKQKKKRQKKKGVFHHITERMRQSTESTHHSQESQAPTCNLSLQDPTMCAASVQGWFVFLSCRGPTYA